MARIGYARVSSQDQDLSGQIACLESAGCAPIRAEKVSGASRDGRSELASVMDFIRHGDELVVHKLDRLGRSTRDILNLVHELDAKGASLRVLEPEITTGGDLGRLVITVLGMVAELERKHIRERQQMGIEAAKARGGVYRGRKKVVNASSIASLKAEGLGPTAIAARLGVSRMTVHRELKRLANSAASSLGGPETNGDLKVP